MYYKPLLTICVFFFVANINAGFEQQKQQIAQFIKLWEKKQYSFFEQYAIDNSYAEKSEKIAMELYHEQGEQLSKFWTLHTQNNTKSIYIEGEAIIKAIYDFILKTQFFSILNYLKKAAVMTPIIHDAINNNGVIYNLLLDLVFSYDLSTKGNLLKYGLWEKNAWKLENISKEITHFVQKQEKNTPKNYSFLYTDANNDADDERSESSENSSSDSSENSSDEKQDDLNNDLLFKLII